MPDADHRSNTVIPADTAHCKTRRASLYETAKLNKGIVLQTEAGDLTIAAGLTDAKRASIIANAHRFLSHNTD